MKDNDLENLIFKRWFSWQAPARPTLAGTVVFILFALISWNSAKAADGAGGGGAGSSLSASISGETFQLQLNAFKNHSNAKRFLKRLVKKGYKPYLVVIDKDDPWFKVRMGPYTSKEKATQVAMELKEKHDLLPLVFLTEKKVSLPAVPAPLHEYKPVEQAKADLPSAKIAVEPAKPSPATTEPEKQKPVPAEPEKPESAKAEQAKPEPEKPEPAKLEPAKAESIKAKPEKTDSPEKESIVTSRIEPEPVADFPVAPENTGDSIDAVLSQFLVWLQAWESKQLDSYFSFYSQNFESQGKALNDWQRIQTESLEQLQKIKIEVNDLEILEKGDTVEMSFLENFQSEGFSDIRRKSLVWKKETGRWRIIVEISEPA